MDTQTQLFQRFEQLNEIGTALSSERDIRSTSSSRTRKNKSESTAATWASSSLTRRADGVTGESITHIRTRSRSRDQTSSTARAWAPALNVS